MDVLGDALLINKRISVVTAQILSSDSSRPVAVRKPFGHESSRIFRTDVRHASSGLTSGIAEDSALCLPILELLP